VAGETMDTSMYESFFGLKEKAFNLTPDPDFLYLNSRTKGAFEDILYGIERREGFAVVVGDVGTGKTTLCCALLDRIEGKKNVFTVLIQNPMLSEVDILRSILQDLGAPQRFGAAWKRDMTKKELIDCLKTILAENAREDAFTVLIIDEAQNLSLEMLEQLRLLSNLETTKKKLLQIIFLGQPELNQKLTQLRQLNQRVSVCFETRPLSREDTEKYIRHRLAVAGGTHKVLFGPGALSAIQEYSGGYPRLINLICDRSLREAFREQSVTVTRPMVRRASLGIAGTRQFANRLHGWRFKAAVAAVLLLLAATVLLLSGRREIPVGKAPEDSRQPSMAMPSQGQALPEAQAKQPVPVDSLPTPKPSPAKPPEVEYFLQVHSFRNGDAAEQTARELKALNLPCFVEHHSVEGDIGWYGVYVGPFAGIEAARLADSEVRAATRVSPVLRERSTRARNVPRQ
jgi:general secretion pathway protein A